jgi:AAA+ superfamily predicted ATPase
MKKKESNTPSLNNIKKAMERLEHLWKGMDQKWKGMTQEMSFVDEEEKDNIGNQMRPDDRNPRARRTGGTPPPPNDMIGRFFVHIRTNRLYRCVQIRDVQDHGIVVFIEQLGTSAPFGFSITKFTRTYRQCTPEETAIIDASQDRITQGHAAVRMEELQTAAGTPDSAVGLLVTPDERDDFKNLTLQTEVKRTIDSGLSKIKLKDFLNDEWDMKSIEPMGSKCGLNFYGPPGTGKTASARAIARQLEKKLFQVDYAQIVSKFLGDTGKHIAEAFKFAKDNNAILFFDEADSMLSKRIDQSSEGQQAWANSVNQNRNILMQEIDRFDGIIIFATNLFSNYDEALLRRIAQHIEFKLPTSEMREVIFNRHIPLKVNKSIDVDLKMIASFAEKFSGGDIKNACINAIVEAACSTPQQLTQDILLSEVQKIKDAKLKHKTGGKFKNPIGINKEIKLRDDA